MECCVLRAAAKSREHATRNEIGSCARMFKIGRDNVTNATGSLGLHLNDFRIAIKAN